MIKKSFKHIENISKIIIPRRFHPLFTPLKISINHMTKMRRLTCIWFITWSCNNKCPYCWQLENIEEFRMKTDVTYQQWLNGFHKMASQFDEIVCGISGGEPFTYKNFLPLLENLPKNMYFDITSNLSFDVQQFLKVAKNCVGVVCSFHPSNANNSKDYIANFTNKVKALTVLPNTRVNFVAAPQNIRFYHEIKELCDNLRIPLHVDAYAPLHEENRIPFETSEDEEFAKVITSKDRDSFIKQSNMEQQRMVECSAGCEHLVLLPDGSAYPCLRYAQKKNQFVGMFTEDSYKMNSKYMQCSYYPICAGCDFDNIKIK